MVVPPAGTAGLAPGKKVAMAAALGRLAKPRLMPAFGKKKPEAVMFGSLHNLR